jgi:hypothetical protein
MAGIVDGLKVVSEHWSCSEKGGGERVLHWGERRRRKRKRQVDLWGKGA